MTADPRYPIGRFDLSAPVTPDMRTPAIEAIAELPARMRIAVSGLSDAQVDTPYRAGGWTVRQLVHHVADSHANGYLRMKLALTADQPTITAYAQALWAALPDSTLALEASLSILDGVHARWTAMWRSLAPAQFARSFHHPELGVVSLDTQLQQYAWHSRHHVAHIASLRQRERW